MHVKVKLFIADNYADIETAVNNFCATIAPENVVELQYSSAIGGETASPTKSFSVLVVYKA